jgi:hypothetical protein
LKASCSTRTTSGHAARAGQAVGRHGHDAVAQFLQRGHLRPAPGALLAEGDQQAQPAAVDEGREAVGVDAHHHLARRHRDHLLGRALVRHMDPAEAALAANSSSSTTCGVVPTPLVAMVSSPGPCAAQGEQVVQRPERAGRRHHDAEGDAAELQDRRGVADRVPQHLLHQGARNTGCGICAMV